jgi:hypothetical protein
MYYAHTLASMYWVCTSMYLVCTCTYLVVPVLNLVHTAGGLQQSFDSFEELTLPIQRPMENAGVVKRGKETSEGSKGDCA